ncbi:MAG: DNA polymerase III subunit [Deltaproteobacteria bacterium]|nr:DNA polymerase III subunit [Deltaproteobacteria bacterium]
MIGALGLPGNLPIQERLLAYLNGGKVHNAIILAGPDRQTKLAVAKNVAKFILCKKKESGCFCGSCSTCQRIDRECHPDVLMFCEEGEDTIKVDTVREICRQMVLSPMEATSKICLLDECHRMTAASSNAFLKTLEEPAPNRYFFLLTTKAGSLLPTVLSRCLQFSFEPPDELACVASDRQVAFEGLLKNFMENGDPTELRTLCEDKGTCLQFVSFLQSFIRKRIVDGLNSEPFLSSVSWLDAFDECVALEGRLRSNANCALMLESYLLTHFAS